MESSLPDPAHTCFAARQVLQRGDPACIGSLAAWRAHAALHAQDCAWGAALCAAAQGLAWAARPGSWAGEGDTYELRLLAALALLHGGQADRGAAALNALAGMSAFCFSVLETFALYFVRMPLRSCFWAA